MSGFTRQSRDGPGAFELENTLDHAVADDGTFVVERMRDHRRIAAIDDCRGELLQYMDQCVAGQVFKIVQSMPPTASSRLPASQYRRSILADTHLTV